MAQGNLTQLPATHIAKPKTTTTERKIGKLPHQVVSSHNTTAPETARALNIANARRKGIGQTSTAYTLSRGVANVGVEEVRQTGNGQVKIIHTVPVMTDTERDAAKKRIGSDLYEIFMRIQAELCLDNEITQK